MQSRRVNSCGYDDMLFYGDAGNLWQESSSNFAHIALWKLQQHRFD